MQKLFSSNGCSCEAEVNPMASLDRVGSLSIMQCSCSIDMTRLGLHIRHGRTCV